MAKWSRDLEDLSLELEKISDNLCNFAYDMSDHKQPYSAIEDIIFSSCNHISRIIEDMKELDGELTELRDRERHRQNQPQKLTETVTTTKTLYL